MAEQVSQPQVITLDKQNSVQILSNFIDQANKTGAFLLGESDILKRSKDVLLNGKSDTEINVQKALELFLQGITKSQSKGCFTLEESSILFKVVQFISANSSQWIDTVGTVGTIDDDLSSLSQPVPIKSPKTI